MRRKILSDKIIVKKAEKIIKEEGLEKCSMRRLSKELGIGVGTIFNYFESREVLLEAVFMSSWQKTLDLVDQTIENDLDTITSLKEIFTIITDDVMDRRGLGTLLKASDSGFWVKGNNFITLAFCDAFEHLLVKDAQVSESKKMARWLTGIILLSVKEYREMTDQDWYRIESMLYLL